MNFDPRLLTKDDPREVLLPDVIVVEQELLDMGLSYDQAEAAMLQASRELGDSNIEETAINLAQQLSQDTGLQIPAPSADDIAAAKAAIQAAQGGTMPIDADVQAALDTINQPMAVDPSIQQVLDANALIAQALYDVVKLADAAKPVGAPPSYDDLVQDAKTQVNALNPSKFVF